MSDSAMKLAGGFVGNDGLTVGVYVRTRETYYRPWMLADIIERAAEKKRSGRVCKRIDSRPATGLVHEGYDYIWQ